MSRPYAKCTITMKAERSLRSGHPWVYAEEITQIEGSPCNGDLIDVFSQKQRWMGTGFYNEHSKIRVRILSHNPNDRFDQAFWKRRLNYAITYRQTVMGEDFSACRLIFGEADGFPGLTIDRFNDVLVSEVLSLGMELRRDEIYELLIDLLAQQNITIRRLYERCDAALREKEGMERHCGFYTSPRLALDTDPSPTVIVENGLEFMVDFIGGQKTGYFLDQKYNRAAAARLAPGRRVLDCCTHTGSFALHAAAAGAASVTALDISAEALEMARRNAIRNGLSDRIDFVCADLFDFLSEKQKKHDQSFDYIILDPPAFTKSASTADNAYRGYKEINFRAMKLLPRGGYLATCSCSHFMPQPRFCTMLREAAADADVRLRQIEARQQGPDHPILWGVPETDYLKFFLFQIV